MSLIWCTCAAQLRSRKGNGLISAPDDFNLLNVSFEYLEANKGKNVSDSIPTTFTEVLLSQRRPWTSSRKSHPTSKVSALILIKFINQGTKEETFHMYGDEALLLPPTCEFSAQVSYVNYGILRL